MHRKTFDFLLSAAALILVVVLVVLGVYMKDRYDFAQGTVKTQLADQKIFFAPKSALSPEELKNPHIVKYAGKQVVNGEMAEVYANDYIGGHLKGIAGGKTYSQVSEESRANPNDEKLAGQVQTLFRGETLRGLLLTTYGFWQFGNEARLAMFICFIAAALLLVFSALGFYHASRTPKDATI